MVILFELLWNFIQERVERVLGGSTTSSPVPSGAIGSEPLTEMGDTFQQDKFESFMEDHPAEHGHHEL